MKHRQGNSVEDIWRYLDELTELVLRLEQRLLPSPHSVVLSLEKGSPMPLTLPDTDRAQHTATVTYKNADGSEYTGPTTGFAVTFASSDLNIATVDGNSGMWSLIGADGTDTISVSVTLPNGTVLTASDTVTAEAPAPPFPTAVTLTLT